MIIRRIAPEREQRKLRVAAYCRVSTTTEEQTESYETQMDYYTRLIKQNSNWEYVDIYADRKSATSAEHRPEFQRMMADGRDKKFDILLVKAISRFARNVVDAQKYVHELKGYDVEVRFENESISSADPTAEMMFNILAVTAQEESRIKSEYVRWSYRKLAEQGIRHIGNNRVLGYDEVKGKLAPNGDAWIPRQIITEYAAGLSLKEIIQRLDAAGAKRLRGNKPFTMDAIYSIIGNVLYVGDRLLQKEAPHNYLTKRPDPTVAFQSHFIKNDHEGIIDRGTWKSAQARLKCESSSREAGIHKRGYSHFLYGVVFCGKCGKPYKRETEYRKGQPVKVWKCYDRKHGAKCHNPNMTEEDLLHAISDDLGWAWTGVDGFDAWAFEQLVSKVEVGTDGIKVFRQAA